MTRPVDRFSTIQAPGIDPLAADWSYDDAVNLFLLSPADMDPMCFDFADSLANTDTKYPFMDPFAAAPPINASIPPAAEDTVSMSSVRTCTAASRAQLTFQRIWTVTTSHGHASSPNSRANSNQHEMTTCQHPSQPQPAPPPQPDGPPAPNSDPKTPSLWNQPPSPPLHHTQPLHNPQPAKPAASPKTPPTPAYQVHQPKAA